MFVEIETAASNIQRFQSLQTQSGLSGEGWLVVGCRHLTNYLVDTHWPIIWTNVGLFTNYVTWKHGSMGLYIYRLLFKVVMLAFTGWSVRQIIRSISICILYPLSGVSSTLRCPQGVLTQQLQPYDMANIVTVDTITVNCNITTKHL